MSVWRIFSNLDGSFTLYEDPLGDVKDSAALGVVAVISLAILVAPIFSNPSAFVPALVCFLLALVFRLFFANNLFFLCPLFLPFAACAFISFSTAVVNNGEGGLPIVSIPIIVIVAILFGLLASKLMAEYPDAPSEFNYAMVVLFGLSIGISTPMAALGMGNGTVLRYSVLLLELLTAVLVVRSVVVFIKASADGKISPVELIDDLVMFAVGCGVFILMCALGAVFGELSGILCVALFVLITVFYAAIYKLLFKRNAWDATALRFALLPTALICLLDCLGSAEFEIRDAVVTPIAHALGRLHLLPWLSGLFDNVKESFAVLFAGVAELFCRLIEEIFNCNIKHPHLSDFAGMLLGLITIAVAMAITDTWMERAQRRRAIRAAKKSK